MRKLTLLLAIMLFSTAQMLAQRTITGTVRDDEGKTLPSATVLVNGDVKYAAQTDLDGKYSIKIPSVGKFLRFSFVGMKSQDIQIGGGNTIDVILESEASQLEGVIVVAYGTTTKKSSTGAVSVIKGIDLVKSSGGITSAIQGTVPGVQVVAGAVRIRGYGSFSASGEPLYVVDGVVGAPYPRDEDIDAFSILKDASSTALYGSRAANGVIIITTKKGRKDMKPTFEFKYTHGITSIIKPDYNYLNADEHFRMIWLGLKNSNPKNATNANVIKQLNGLNPYNMAEPLDANGNLKPEARMLYSTDWRNASIKDGKADAADFSVRGGSANSLYYWSGGYSNWDGFTSADYSRTYKTLFNFSSNLNKAIEVGTNISLSYNEYGSMYTSAANENNLLYVSRVLTPVAPIYQLEKVYDDASKTTWTYKEKLDANGKPIWDWSNPNYKNYNPLAQLEVDPRDGYGYRQYMAPFVNIKIIEGLTFKGNAALSMSTERFRMFQDPRYASGQTENGLSYMWAEHTRSWFTSGALNYIFKIKENNNFNAYVGVERDDYKNNTIDGTRIGYDLGNVTTELSMGVKPKDVNSSTLERGLLSYLTFFKYNYAEKYFLDLSFRRDGSSKFGANKKWGNFWSVGSSWLISEEDFMRSYKWINTLKLRASYGVTGTDAIASYRYGDYYSLGYNYNGKTGIKHDNLPNEDLGWEQNNSFTMGLDFGFWGILQGSIDYYNKDTKDLLMDVRVPYTTGFVTKFMNVGKMNNKGVELLLTVSPLRTGNLKWTSTFTLTHNQNTIKALPQEQILSGTKIYKVGGTLYDFYMREWAGVNPDNGAPLWYKDKKDANGNVIGKETTSSYSDADRYIPGRSTPDAIISLTNAFEYKGFDLSFQLYSSLGGKIYDGEYASMMHDGSSKINQLPTDALNSWKKPGDQSDVPIFILGNTNQSNYLSTRFLTDATFFKLKNLSLGYTLPKQFVSKAKLEIVRFFVTGDNLVILSKFKSGDPERYISGVTDNTSFPNSRTVRLGVNIKF